MIGQSKIVNIVIGQSKIVNIAIGQSKTVNIVIGQSKIVNIVIGQSKIVNIVIGQSKIVNIVIGQSKTCVTTISSPGFRHISVQWAEPIPLENKVYDFWNFLSIAWSWLGSYEVKLKTLK